MRIRVVIACMILSVVAVGICLWVKLVPIGKEPVNTNSVAAVKNGRIKASVNTNSAVKNSDGSYDIQFSIQPKLVDGTNSVGVGKQ